MSLLDFIPPPYNLLAKIALPILILGGAYLAGDIRGHRAGAEHVQAIYQKAAEKALRAMQAGAVRIDSLNGLYATASAAQQQETRDIYHDTLRIIERPIYGNACVDADGVQLLDRARANSNRALDPVEPARGAR